MGRSKSSNPSQPPETELKCQELQALYLQPDCPQSIKEEYFLLLRTYARSLTLKNIKRLGIYLPPERVDEICTDATLLILDQYKKEGWSIRASFAGALYWKIVEAMYSEKDDEISYSLNTTFTSDQNSKEIMDLIGTDSDLPWQSALGRSLISADPADNLAEQDNVAYDEIKGLIDQAYDILPYPTFLRFLPWLVLQLRRPKTRNIQQLFETLYLTNRESSAFDILWLEIKNRIAGHVVVDTSTEIDFPEE